MRFAAVLSALSFTRTSGPPVAKSTSFRLSAGSAMPVTDGATPENRIAADGVPESADGMLLSVPVPVFASVGPSVVPPPAPRVISVYDRRSSSSFGTSVTVMPPTKFQIFRREGQGWPFA